MPDPKPPSKPVPHYRKTLRAAVKGKQAQCPLHAPPARLGPSLHVSSASVPAAGPSLATPYGTASKGNPRVPSPRGGAEPLPARGKAAERGSAARRTPGQRFARSRTRATAVPRELPLRWAAARGGRARKRYQVAAGAGVRRQQLGAFGWGRETTALAPVRAGRPREPAEAVRTRASDFVPLEWHPTACFLQIDWKGPIKYEYIRPYTNKPDAYKRPYETYVNI